VQLDLSGFITHAELVALFKRESTFRTCAKDRVLFRQGDRVAGLYTVLSGGTTISINSHGRPFAITVQTTAGSLLDLFSLVYEETHMFTAAVHRGAELGFLNLAAFIDLLEADLRLYKQIQRVIAAEVDFACRAIVRGCMSDMETHGSCTRPEFYFGCSSPLAAESSEASRFMAPRIECSRGLHVPVRISH